MSVRSPRPEQPRLIIEPPDEAARVPEAAATVNADPNPPPVLPPREEPAPPPPRPSRSWAQRIWLVVFVIFCLEVGLLLVVLPWTQFWTSNRLLVFLPWLRPIMEHSFVRGAVSGLGLLDLWIGISELGFRSSR